MLPQPMMPMSMRAIAVVSKCPPLFDRKPVFRRRSGLGSPNVELTRLRTQSYYSTRSAKATPPWFSPSVASTSGLRGQTSDKSNATPRSCHRSNRARSIPRRPLPGVRIVLTIRASRFLCKLAKNDVSHLLSDILTEKEETFILGLK
jgi:hypothetical protein